jgi:hypothetical protein
MDALLFAEAAPMPLRIGEMKLLLPVIPAVKSGAWW